MGDRISFHFRYKDPDRVIWGQGAAVDCALVVACSEDIPAEAKDCKCRKDHSIWVGSRHGIAEVQDGDGDDFGLLQMWWNYNIS